VIDSHGQVIGVAKGKFVGDGVEALGFAIPVSVACAQLNVCEET
jgi:S1-C subfamily serine protease